eukprot:3109394-Amphidinium_carterae.1
MFIAGGGSRSFRASDVAQGIAACQDYAREMDNITHPNHVHVTELSLEVPRVCNDGVQIEKDEICIVLNRARAMLIFTDEEDFPPPFADDGSTDTVKKYNKRKRADAAAPRTGRRV